MWSVQGCAVFESRSMAAAGCADAEVVRFMIAVMERRPTPQSDDDIAAPAMGQQGGSIDNEAAVVNEVKESSEHAIRLGSRIAQRFTVVGLDGECSEVRGQSVRPAVFES